MNDRNRDFEQLLEGAVSPYHTVLEARERLEARGFEYLDAKKTWNVRQGGAYVTTFYGSTLFAFVLGEISGAEKKLRIGAAHTDFPGFVIKHHPDLENEGYRQLNVEVYGGPILNTWLDRPLSVAGRVALRGDSAWKPEIRYVNVRKPFLTIPNLAIHMNREVNKGIELNRQTDLLPIWGLSEGIVEKDGFHRYLAQVLSVVPEDILDYDLRLYCAESPAYLGTKGELISAPHLDNTTSVEALLEGIIHTKEQDTKGIKIIALFDHEEIGSRTKQGAFSMLMREVIKKITDSMPEGVISVEALLEDAMMLSVDVAHGVHPNYVGKMDVTNHPVLGRGFCIKEAGAQSYATDCEAIAVLKQICRQKQVPYQTFVNRSDQAGGGTLGAAAAAFLPIPIVDLGIPLLAMHSARELMGTADLLALSDCLKAFFTA